ncbi:MAG TPA: LptA/OstA family protein [Steroidobacter sp.]|uniref:LptA/OstA family protein n=1 Tax=Steroidobacter sp. TaxID=1978227 RepID=UPI002EDA4D27
MDDSIRNRRGSRHAARGLLLLLFAAASSGAANPPSLDAGFSWSADVLSSDFRNNTLDISGNVRVTQGQASIEAQSAKARNVGSPTQRWTFEDSVRIRNAEADLQSNLATAAVVNGQIASARVEGSPARFEQVNPTNNRQVRGRAGVIEYDFETGIVKLTNQVWFSNGKDEFRGDVVIYNVRDERVQINPGGSSNRVRGIIRPNQDKTQSNSGGTAATVAPTFNETGEATTHERAEPRLATQHGGGA